MFRVVVVGGCAVDEGYRATSPSVTHTKMLATSTPCRFLFRAAGGVGRNLADVLRKLLPTDSYAVDLVSVVGNDSEGAFLLSRCSESQLGTRLVVQWAHQTKLVDATRHEELRSEAEQEDARPQPASTAKYVAILDGSGELAAAAAAMSIFESKEFFDHIQRMGDELVSASAVVVDTNLPAPHFRLALTLAQQQRNEHEHEPQSQMLRRRGQHNAFKLIAIDPISVEKGRRVVPVLMKRVLLGHRVVSSEQGPESRRNVMTIIKPNHIEAGAMAEELLSRAPAQLEISAEELARRLRAVLPRRPLPRSDRNDAAVFSNFQSSSSSSSSSLSSSTSWPLTGQINSHNDYVYFGMDESAHQLLYEASRNAVILMFLMEVDLVIVSCGSCGSIACFSSFNGNENAADETTEGRSDMNVVEFNRTWREVPLESGKNYFLRWFPPQKVRKVEKVTGAGDTFFGSVISHLLVSMTIPHDSHSDEDESIRTGRESESRSDADTYYVWKKLTKYAKSRHISQAIENASHNASLALTTKSGATPKLITLSRSGLTWRAAQSLMKEDPQRAPKISKL